MLQQSNAASYRGFNAKNNLEKSLLWLDESESNNKYTNILEYTDLLLFIALFEKQK